MYDLQALVSSAGDVNGDGFDDLIVGLACIPTVKGLLKSYVVFGSSGGFSANQPQHSQQQWLCD